VCGRILIVDDEASMREFLAICLRRGGHAVDQAAGGKQGLGMLGGAQYDLVITDLKMPGTTGLDVLDAVKKQAPSTEVIVITAYATPETAIAAMKRGAYDYLTKPFKLEEIEVVVQRAMEKRTLVRENTLLRAELQGQFRLDRLVGKSDAMTRVFQLVRKVAATKTNVLITGESGTGKELVARALHHAGMRPEGPYVAVNCGAIPEALLESELFGHVKGAFTGADRENPGLFVSAHGGTLFLDEIGELPMALQVKLLRALQERTIRPVGGATEREIDTRVVAASNRDLEGEVARGVFRQDLYYRLNVIQVQMPPLRARRDDVPLLAQVFLERCAAEVGKPVPQLDPDALRALCEYDYPGNVRELENLMERAVTLATDSVITRDLLPELAPRRRPTQAGDMEFPPEGLDLERVLGDVEREFLMRALGRASGVRKEAARLLGISFRSIRYRLAKHGIDPGADEGTPLGLGTPPVPGATPPGGVAAPASGMTSWERDRADPVPPAPRQGSRPPS
jgi:two-component system response regulator PilR (NtrC family)